VDEDEGGGEDGRAVVDSGASEGEGDDPCGAGDNGVGVGGVLPNVEVDVDVGVCAVCEN